MFTKNSLNQNILFLTIILSISVIYIEEGGNVQSGSLPYVVLLVGTFFIILNKVFSSANTGLVLYLPHVSPESCLYKSLIYLKYSWIFIILTWVYGVVIGLLNGVDPGFVFRNYFGMNLYFLLPVFFWVKPKRASVILALAIAALIQLLYVALLILDNGLSFWYLNTISDGRLVYSVALVVFYPFVLIGIMRILFPSRLLGERVKSIPIYISAIIFILGTFVIVIVTGSKGFLLAWGFMIAYTFMVFLWHMVSSGKSTLLGILVALFILVTTGYFVYVLFDLLVMSYSIKEASNSIRAEQFRHLISDLNYLGNGLGSVLSSGYATNTKLPYGLELNYLNIIHKIGVFSLPLFIAYILTGYVAIYRSLKGKDFFYSMIVIALMSYAIIGIGNPILLGPVSVLLHVIAIYFLTSFRDEQVNR
jgi:hypothetical protein